PFSPSTPHTEPGAKSDLTLLSILARSSWMSGRWTTRSRTRRRCRAGAGSGVPGQDGPPERPVPLLAAGTGEEMGEGPVAPAGPVGVGVTRLGAAETGAAQQVAGRTGGRGPGPLTARGF